MIHDIYENEPLRWEPETRHYLSDLLGGRFERREHGWAICRVAGHIELPTGDALRIRSRKFGTGSLLACMAFVDPRLRSIRLLGRLKGAGKEGDVFAALALAFLRELLAVTNAHGLRRTYHRVEVESGAIRGRINFAKLVRSGGDASRLPCHAWERLPLTGLNQTLCATVDVLARSALVRQAAAKDLAQARALFTGIPPRVSQPLVSGAVPLARADRDYGDAMALARLVLRSSALLEGTSVGGLAHLVSIDDLFERAVVEALRLADARSLAKAPVHYQRWTAEVPSTGRMVMDAYAPSPPLGPLVVDAKLKAEVTSADLRQIVTYCFATGATRGVLVVPEGTTRLRSRFRFAGRGLQRGVSPASIDVFVVGMRVTAGDLMSWRSSAAELAAALRGLSPAA